MYHYKKRSFDDFINNNLTYNPKYDLIDYLLDIIDNDDNFNIRPKSI
jgi:hypothetical protein